MKLCHCGKPLHYTDASIQRQVEKLVSDLGEYVTVVVGDKKYKCQRHFIALHGLKAAEISTLGFEEIN